MSIVEYTDNIYIYTCLFIIVHSNTQRDFCSRKSCDVWRLISAWAHHILLVDREREVFFCFNSSIYAYTQICVCIHTECAVTLSLFLSYAQTQLNISSPSNHYYYYHDHHHHHHCVHVSNGVNAQWMTVPVCFVMLWRLWQPITLLLYYYNKWE